MSGSGLEEDKRNRQNKVRIWGRVVLSGGQTRARTWFCLEDRQVLKPSSVKAVLRTQTHDTQGSGCAQTLFERDGEDG